MLEGNALLQPAADINYGSGATSVPLALPACCCLGAATLPRQEPQGGCRCCSHDAAEPPKTPHSLNLNCHPVSYPMMHCCNIATPPGVYRKTRHIILNSSDCFATIMYHLVFFMHDVSNCSEHSFSVYLGVINDTRAGKWIQNCVFYCKQLSSR